MFTHKPKTKIWRYIVVGFVLAAAAAGFFAYRRFASLNPIEVLSRPDVQNHVADILGADNADLLKLAPHVLGLEEPATILVLFLNNTELRPGGGFIGAYATLRVDNGKAAVLAMEGTESLDGRADIEQLPAPPKPIGTYMGIGRWFFRDSNWSPDFRISARKALELYKKEQGVAADDVDFVVGVTTHVLEEALGLSGPVTVDGLTFDRDRVVELLEYEVEYGYKERGIPFEQRKAIMRPLMDAILERLTGSAFLRLKQYTAALEALIAQKHIMVYATDPELQDDVEQQRMAGEVKSSQGDYLGWVDANLAALKTDHAMERHLSYHLTRQDEGGYIASATMEYKHTGSFDWRTTRYRTYARVFVPADAYVTSVIDSGGVVLSHDQIDRGVEGDKQWFGYFVSIEPGTVKTVSFIYALPRRVSDSIASGLYTLSVQKQLGTEAHGLTLDLNFGKTITAAVPAEQEANWNDDLYRLETDLREDRSFAVNF